MAFSYLDVARYTVLTVLDPARIRDLNVRRSGFIEGWLEIESRWIEDKLRHRYRIPFPERHSTIEKWIVRLVNHEVAFAIGYEAIDIAAETLKDERDATRAEVVEAAKPESPQMNLPLKDGQDATAIAKGAPLGYAESSPYMWSRRQGRAR